MSDLIVLDELPDAKNELAKAVRPHMAKMVRLLPSYEDRLQFASAVVIACNELDARKVSDIRSMLGAAIGCVRMGLMPGAEMGLAYFVPFKGRVTLVPGYRGFLYLATRNNYLRWVSTEVVYRGEEFRHWHDERGPHISHEIPLDRATSDSDIVGAYCSYQTTQSDAAVPVVINRSAIDKARATSQTAKVWGPHFAEMAMKTALRRASKRWNLTPALAKAIHYDELAERGEPQPVELLDGVDAERPGVRRLSDLPAPVALPDGPVEPVESPVFASLMADASKSLDRDEAAALMAEIAAEREQGTITAEQAAEIGNTVGRNEIQF